MYEFPKSERLCGQMHIQHLYQTGRKFTVWPLRVTYAESEGRTQVLVWAPKSSFKHAVDRNRIRRLMREAWRLNSLPLKEEGKPCYQIALNYIDKEIQDYRSIERAVCKAVKKIDVKQEERKDAK